MRIDLTITHCFRNEVVVTHEFKIDIGTELRSDVQAEEVDSVTRAGEGAVVDVVVVSNVAEDTGEFDRHVFTILCIPIYVGTESGRLKLWG